LKDSAVENYFNYFTEIEEHFQRQRGSALLLTTLDWALIETWKDAGIPLEAVVRGIDSTFERYAKRPARSRKINGLAYCSQEVLAAVEDMKEATLGVAKPESSHPGLDVTEIVAFLQKNAALLEAANLPETTTASPRVVAVETARALHELAENLRTNSATLLEDIERRLTVMEEKLFAVLHAAASDEALVQLRAAADRELAPYLRKMPAAQIAQLHKQFVHKRLLEQYSLPRLSLFYM
jgi:hypothetical protein